jgi:hypothetical protein
MSAGRPLCTEGGIYLNQVEAFRAVRARRTGQGAPESRVGATRRQTGPWCAAGAFVASLESQPLPELDRYPPFAPSGLCPSVPLGV